MKSFIETTKNCLWDDLYNRYFVVFTVIVGLIEYVVWSQAIVGGGIFVYTRLSYYPVQLLIVIFILHLILSIYSFRKDEHISHLLLGALPVLAIFVLILEIFYINGAK